MPSTRSPYPKTPMHQPHTLSTLLDTVSDSLSEGERKNKEWQLKAMSARYRRPSVGLSPWCSDGNRRRDKKCPNGVASGRDTGTQTEGSENG